MIDIDAERNAVVREAKTWIGTPFHYEARVKGAGVDCGELLLMVYEACGVFARPSREIMGRFRPLWFMHKNDEPYLKLMNILGVEVDPPPRRVPLPGDALIWYYGIAYSHGGIVVNWPDVLHTFTNSPCMIEDALRAASLNNADDLRFARRAARHPMKVFVPKRWMV